MFRSSSKARNVVHLGLGFICVFFAFNSQGFIEETVIDNASKSGNINKHAGYYSLAIIYAFSMATNIMVAPLVDMLGPRWSMFGGGFMYTLFQIGMLFLNETYLYVSSALLGIGSAFIWTGQGKYLSLNTTKRTAGRNSGLLWGMLQTSLVGGGIFLFAIFSGSNSNNIDKKQRQIIYGVFSAVSLIGNILLLLLPMPEPNEDDDENASELPKQKLSQFEVITGAFRLLITPHMILLVVAFIYTGLELSYWSGVYSTAISRTKNFHFNTHKIVALNAICQGVGQIVGGLCFGIFGDKFRRFGRHPIVITGYLAHLICYALSFINLPFGTTIRDDYDAYIHPSIALALIVGVLLGFGDAAWNTQMYSLLIGIYSDRIAQAFSIMKFFQAAAACGAFFYTSAITLQWILLILLITSTIGLCCFTYVELSTRRQSQIDSAKNEAS
uniref:UNC93-like protein MFSD11 n=1 Tax=Syphacia muris TaxID=451379 RepID=A0A0N5AB91_9BILA